MIREKRDYLAPDETATTTDAAPGRGLYVASPYTACACLCHDGWGGAHPNEACVCKGGSGHD